jgi:hypothetical protein
VKVDACVAAYIMDAAEVLYSLFLIGLKKYISVPTRDVHFYRCSPDRETNPYYDSNTCVTVELHFR